MVKVKVCGITNVADALKAVELGADALGFNFYPPSPRYIRPDKARAILAELSGRICCVALFVNEAAEKVREIVNCGRFSEGRHAFRALQFHGEESRDYCRGWEFKVIKAFRLQDRGSLAQMNGFPADFYLVDSWSPGYGGSGSPFSWDWLQGVAPDRLVLAGGLNVENVAVAIQRIRPYGVDVCTGVEARPGIKDHEKLKEFLRIAKQA